MTSQRIHFWIYIITIFQTLRSTLRMQTWIQNDINMANDLCSHVEEMFKKRLLMSLWFRASEFRTTDAQPSWEYPLLGFVWLAKMCVDGIFRIRTFLIYPKAPKIHNTNSIPNTSWRVSLPYKSLCKKNCWEIVCQESMEKTCNQNKTGLYLRKHKLFCVAGVDLKSVKWSLSVSFFLF